MRTKLSVVREAMRAGRWEEALSISAKFPQLGEHKRAIVTAHEAVNHSAFYKQLRKDPAALIEAGKAALIERFGFGEE